MSVIQLNGMEFYAYHGCFPEESVVGTRFIIDLELFLDTNSAEISDNLNDTINYLSVYQMVKSCMQTKSKLLEHLAHQILLSIYKQYPELEKIRIKVSKTNPPLGGQLSSVSIILQYDGNSFF